MDVSMWQILLFSAAFGAFAITACFHFSIYLQQKDRVYLNYSTYLALYAIFILIRLLDERMTDLWPLSYPVVYHGDELMAKVTLAAYVNFMGSLFVTPDMKFHMLGWRIMNFLTFGYVLLYIAMLIAGVDLSVLETMSFASSIILISLGLLLIVKAFTFYRNPFYQLIIIGSLFVAFSTLSGVLYNVFTGDEKLGLTAYTLMIAGCIPEIIFLSSALGYRLKMAAKEKAEAQQELILQLQRNEQLVNSANEALEASVKARTAEIQEKSALLEREREEKFLAEVDKQIAEAQLTALNAQMNPHFIFNCMNSIQKYILKNEKSKALDFLQNFSDLMRRVLDNSTKTKVGLDEEINMLEKYLLLEQQRLDQKFDYEIRVAPDLQTDFFEVPGMIIQPYIENAIWHGLMNKPEQGHLLLQFDRVNGSIRCVVEDDGIGRRKSAALYGQTNTHRKGYGMSISRKRLELLHKENAEVPEVRVEDLTDRFHQAAGTRVSLYFHIDA